MGIWWQRFWNCGILAFVLVASEALASVRYMIDAFGNFGFSNPVV